jgi:hypothetical protein
LERVGNILEGALGVGRKEGTTQRLQMHEADTLGYYLQDLNVARAREKLGRLAAEAGVALDAGQEAPLAQIDGQIVRGFLDLKKAYEQEQHSLRDLEQRIAALDAVLEGAPDDFKHPQTVPPLEELRQLPEHVRGELEESLAEDVEGLISEHDRTTRLGNFQPLMQAARNLLHGPHMALGRLGGQVLTLENTVSAYRQRLLQAEDVRDNEAALNALLRAGGQPVRPPLGMPDLERAGPLREALRLVKERQTGWVAEGETILDGTGVSFCLWREVVRQIEAHQDPPLSPEQAQLLVDKGFLKRTYPRGGSH